MEIRVDVPVADVLEKVSDSSLPYQGRLDTLIRALVEVQNSVPPEHQAVARYEIGGPVCGMGNGDAYLHVFYLREATTEETAELEKVGIRRASISYDAFRDFTFGRMTIGRGAR